MNDDIIEIIDDVEKTERILLKENYFFLNGYRHLFMNSASDRTFVTGATLYIDGGYSAI